MFESDLNEALSGVKAAGLYRSLRVVDGAQGRLIDVDGRKLLCFCSNNYLGLANHPSLTHAVREAVKRFGWGSGASRLITGTMRLHEHLERRLAAFMGTESALLFPSGYMANLGVISALVGRGDLVVVDKLNHASIIDGCRLSGARMRVYPHRNVDRLEKILRTAHGYGRKLVVTDSIFSMDGDLAPLPDIIAVAKRHDAVVMVDEAHAVGVLGAGGRGVAELLGVRDGVHVTVGTLSKALGGAGGFVAGLVSLTDYLKNRARSFIYSTAAPPSVCAAALAALDYVETHPDTRRALVRTAGTLKAGLVRLGFDTLESAAHIIPVVLGGAEEALSFAGFLTERGIMATAIRPPTVPAGTSRLRLSVTALHTSGDIARLLRACASSRYR
jgi:8-amino-7-oxononanoate synthase